MCTLKPRPCFPRLPCSSACITSPALSALTPLLRPLSLFVCHSWAAHESHLICYTPLPTDPPCPSSSPPPQFLKSCYLAFWDSQSLISKISFMPKLFSEYFSSFPSGSPMKEIWLSHEDLAFLQHLQLETLFSHAPQTVGSAGGTGFLLCSD